MERTTGQLFQQHPASRRARQEAGFARADLTEQDHEAHVVAIGSGRIDAIDDID